MLIGIIGKKQAGKDSVGNILTKYWGFKRYAFADPLKKGCQQFFDLSNEQVWGNDKEVIDERWGVSPRQLLQIMGSEISQFEIGKLLPEFEKKIGRSLWVKLFENYYINNKSKDIYVSDCRFKHEAEIIQSLGGQIWRVTRPNTSYSDSHISENELNNFKVDQIINNNSTLSALEDIVYNIMSI